MSARESFLPPTKAGLFEGKIRESFTLPPTGEFIHFNFRYRRLTGGVIARESRSGLRVMQRPDID